MNKNIQQIEKNIKKVDKMLTDIKEQKEHIERINRWRNKVLNE